ncbi:MAG: 50S ribosomal protein L4 [archaeon]|nr:50S ribosomal protein L4 [archaeon]
MAAIRPLVTIYNAEGEQASQTALPQVFGCPIRTDIVQFVHTQINKNHRQAYAVSEKAGHQTSAESWGTGRAVSRIPRVKGGGTHRSGQAAFGNMCRGGRMFNPTKVWRRWHRKVNIGQRRFAITSALAASAIPALVQARGHRIESLQEVPLVISEASLANINKTKLAVQAFKKLGAYTDVEKADYSKKLRPGKGKSRNRRYRRKLGPLVIYNSRSPLPLAVRNLPGVSLCRVSALNILQLAPAGRVGRFIVWTESAFNALDKLYGSASTKKNWAPPRAKVTNADIDRIIKSDEIKAVTRSCRPKATVRPLKRNPFKVMALKEDLNPYIVELRRASSVSKSAADRKAKILAARKAGKAAAKNRTAFYAQLNGNIGRADQLK